MNKHISELNPFTGSIDGTEYFPLQKGGSTYASTYTKLIYSSSLFHSHSFSEVQGKPTTLNGYGITDAISSSVFNTFTQSYYSATSSFGGTTEDENRIYAIAVTLLRPNKLKYKIGNFGTYIPDERIYARIINLCRMGISENNYVSGIYPNSDSIFSVPVASGSNITAHGSFSSLLYALESDINNVVNAKKTYYRMLGYLNRDSAVYHVQATAAPGKNASGIVPITIGTYGSIVISGEGQGYEADIFVTSASSNYVARSLAPKSAFSGGVANDWVHQWWGHSQVLFPISSSIDQKNLTWGIQVYSSNTGYEGYFNVRVADLPSWWNTDVG